MSVFDIDKADEKIDYEVLYKKRFEKIEDDIEEIKQLYSVDGQIIAGLSEDVNFLKSEFFRHNDILYRIADNMDVLRTMLNQLLPKDQQIFLKDIF